MDTLMLDNHAPGDPARLARIKKDTLIWDMTLPWSTELNEDETLPRFRDAGTNFISLTVALDTDNVSTALQNVARLETFVRRHSDHYVLAKSVAEIEAAKASGKLAIALHTQGTSWLGGDVDLLETFYGLGLRHMLLAYQVRNFVADGCGERTNAGLTRYGLRLIREMNRLGIIVDCSHTGYKSSLEAMEVSTAPCILSHSNARAVFDHYRNVPDELILACARGGGVIGVNGMGNFLSEDGASPEAMFRHIDHMVTLVGAESVGLGFDYIADPVSLARWVNKADGWPDINGKPGNGVSSFVQPEELDALIEVMFRHGYSDDAVKDVLGRSFLRVCNAVWK